MCIAESPDIFHEKILDLIRTLDYVCIYPHDFLTIIRGINNHLSKLEKVLWWLQNADLHVNVAKYNVSPDEIDCLV